MQNFDLYTLKARLVPALITLVPAIAFVIAILDLKSFDTSQAWATVGLTVILLVCANFAREAGKRVQADIYRENGGWPTFDALYYDDRTFSDQAKQRYLAFLSSKIGTPYPSLAEAKNDPAAARDFYNRAATWLRENTRDAARFPIIHDENLTYGFYRNMLGLKYTAILINLAVMAACIGIIYRYAPWFGDAAPRLPYVLAVSAFHLAYLFFGVSKGRVLTASARYSRQLLLACETLI
ncbi:hypothetical protein [Rhizobium leguminosarum]|uniref:hypothetical protein n=1 Tax=Rhizobium leguminosarum TaxID=384 RepID=UPI001C92883B|nr:hypothetical protein [Rhizobium leguminosarum]MBY2997835.1 hypothetical protein [Rhizobium leguminosarum]